MPRSKESMFARSERLQKESLRLRRKGQYDAILLALKQHPEFIGKSYDHLESMFSSVGLALVCKDGSAPPGDEVGSSERNLWGIQKTSKYAKEEVKEGAGEGEQGSASGSIVIAEGAPAKVKQLEMHSVDQIMDLLTKLEPVVFSKAALMGLRVSKARRPSKEALLQLWTFVTNLGADHAVDLKVHQECDDLVERSCSLNVANGRRALKLPLRPDWQNDGVYKLEPSADGQPVLVSMREGDTKPVPPQVLKGVDLSKLYVCGNFSEKRATLKCHGTSLEWPLQLLFADATIERSLTGPSPCKRPPPESAAGLGDVTTGITPKKHRADDGIAKDEGEAFGGGEGSLAGDGLAQPVVRSHDPVGYEPPAEAKEEGEE